MASGTFCFGVAFLFIAAVRAVSGGGLGWQLWFGGLLALIGGVNMASPDVGGLILPALIIGLGAMLLIGSLSRRRDGCACPRSLDRRRDDLGEDLDDATQFSIGHDERRTQQDRVAIRAVGIARARVDQDAPLPGRADDGLGQSGLRGNGARDWRSATSSSPTSRPRPRMSPTFGWPPSAATSSDSEPVALASRWPR